MLDMQFTPLATVLLFGLVTERIYGFLVGRKPARPRVIIINAVAFSAPLYVLSLVVFHGLPVSYSSTGIHCDPVALVVIALASVASASVVSWICTNKRLRRWLIKVGLANGLARQRRNTRDKVPHPDSTRPRVGKGRKEQMT
jgi:hypothetical protein